MAHVSATLPQLSMTLTFGVGTFAPLGAVGCSGWLHSRSAGLAASAIGLVAGITVLLLTVRVR